jgi:(2Fe-2S) ferredoxin
VTDTSERYFALHGFLCTNRRPDDHPRGSCAGRGSEALRDYLKAKVKELGLGRGNRFQQAGCLDRCELGPVMVIYPEGVWYAVRTPADIDEILISHMQGGTPVERLKLDPSERKRAQIADRIAD